MARAGADKLHTSRVWRSEVLKWYPGLQREVYFVPPVYMRRLNYDLHHVATLHVAVPREAVKATPKGSSLVNESDVLEDLEQQRILHCLHKFFTRHTAMGSAHEKEEGTAPDGPDAPDREVLFVLSQLNFHSYLAEPCFAAAAKNFPRPEDLKSQGQDRGDFDLLLIHRHYGLLAAEIKSVGRLFTEHTRAQDDKTLVTRLKRIIKQLNKSHSVLCHVTGDLHSQPRLTKTLMLPNVTSAHLQRVLHGNPNLKQELCACLGLDLTDDPVRLCLTSDHVSDRDQFWEVTDDVIKGMSQWWRDLMTSKGKDPAMSQELYEELVARFAGPASTVEVYCPPAVSGARRVVRTVGEGVSETGTRFMALVLHQQQLSFLHSKQRLVCLTGPPGTGKTVMLLLKGEEWLREGQEVHVYCMYNEGMAASLSMAHGLREKCPSLQHKVHFHARDKDGAREDALKGLISCAKDGRLYVIVDEVDGSQFKDFCDKLTRSVSKLHLWGARMAHDLLPSYVTECRLTVSLRSPAVVTREIEKSDVMNKYKTVRHYDQNDFPHTDGPLIRELRHQGPGHPDDVMPRDCKTCGTQFAAVLKELNVGETDQQTSETDSPDPLQYRDVFLLCLDGFTETSGIIRGLRQAAIPVSVMEAKATYEVSDLVRSVATMQGLDCVIATDCRYVNGLERKIVAWVQTADSDSVLVHFDRIMAFSRTSGQLITITTPSGAEQAAQPQNPLARVQDTVETKIAGEAVLVPEEVEEMLIELTRENLSEDLVRRVNSVFQFNVQYNNGEYHPIYLNLKEGGGA